MNYTQIKKRTEQLIRQQEYWNNKLQSLPEGKLLCSRDKNNFKYYHKTCDKKIYLDKSKRNLAEQLAVKAYIHALLQDISHELTANQFYLRHYTDKSSMESLLNHPGIQKLLSPYFKPHAKELAEWVSSPYNHNPYHPEHLTHKTILNFLVRSKSESMITMLLHTNNIPFRYECELVLGSQIVYPDFTIRHPRTGEWYYWEHLGKMDDPNYYKNKFHLLEQYTSHGIVPSINLILTFETKEHPLTTDVIQKIIEHYFL